MSKDELYKEIEEYLELEDELEINASTTIEDLLEIDSLAHITLITLLKDLLGVELSAEKFATFDTLGDMIDSIDASKFN